MNTHARSLRSLVRSSLANFSRVALVLTLITLANSAAFGQYKPGVEGQIPLGKLDEMDGAVRVATPQQRADLFMRLGLREEIAKLQTEPGVEANQIVFQHIRARGKQQSAILFLPQWRGCWLALLSGSDQDVAHYPWHVTDEKSIDCWGEGVTLDILPLRGAEIDDLFLHHVNEGHGSGYAAYNGEVYSVLSGKLVQTLNAEDYRTEDIIGAGQTEEHKSVFIPFPDWILEETSTLAVNDTLSKAERRYWRWSEQEKRFVAGPFVPVSIPAK